MKNIFHAFIFVLLFSHAVNAQQRYQLLYHPFSSQYPACLIQAVSGGYLLASNFTDSFGEHGILMTRFNDQFNILWEKTIDQIGVDERVHSFYQDSAGDLIIVGSSNGSALILKTDSSLNNLWSYYYQLMNYQSSAHQVIVSSSGSIYILGQTEYLYLNSPAFTTMVLKLSDSGIKMWENIFPNMYHSTFGEQMISLENDTMAFLNIIGVTNGFTYGVTALDSNGWTLWTQYIWANSNNQFFYDLSKANHELALYGYDGQSFVLKINSTDTVRIFNHYQTPNASGPTINIKGIQTKDKCLAMAEGISLNPDYSITLMKIDSNSILQWSRIFSFNQQVGIASIIQTDDNGYLISALLGNNILILKTDSVGNSGCLDSIAALNVSQDTSYSLLFPGGVPFNHLSSTSNYTMNVSSLALSNDIDTLCSLFSDVFKITDKNTFILSPNPAKTQFTITNGPIPIKELDIFNLLGDKIYSATTNSEQISVNCENFPEGIYLVQVTNTAGVQFSTILVVMR